MSDADARHTLVSVRADAQLEVEPDLLRVAVSLSRTAPDAATARHETAQLLQRLTDRLAALGGATKTAASGREPLTWSAQGLQVHSDWDYDENGHRTGLERHSAVVGVLLTVRDFDLLAALQRALTGEDGIDVHSMTWEVDADNAAWAQVRADAIKAALLKGQDYAVALGGAVVAVEHIADAGLLGPAAEARGGWIAHATAHYLKEGDSGAAPTLDPVPQTLTATIDARLTATTGPLPSR